MRRVVVAALVLFVAVRGGAVAQTWPTRPLQVLVPQSAGSANDVLTRLVTERLSARLGQPVVVENRLGAGNTIAMAAVARAPADGYTILANSSTHSLIPVTYRTLPFDTFRDLTPVIPLANMPLVMTVQATKGYEAVAAFVADAKSRPGAMNFASGGTGSITHLAAEAFRLAAGFEAVHVPYKGPQEALIDMVGGRIDLFLAPLTAVLPFLQDHSLQALAVSSAARASRLPDVPTVKESGYPGATYNFWVGFFVPAKTPEPVIDRLYTETATVLKDAELQAKFAQLGADPLLLGRADFTSLIADEFAANVKIAAAAGLQAN